MTKPVAIVTGGSRGVGAEVSKLLASKGWNIAITCSSSIEAANEVSKAVSYTHLTLPTITGV